MANDQPSDDRSDPSFPEAHPFRDRPANSEMHIAARKAAPEGVADARP